VVGTSVIEISTREAAELCRAGGVVFADTRSATRFSDGHIADAVHLPCDATENTAADSLRKVRGARTVVVYGETGSDARAVLETLRDRGLGGDVRVLSGGFRQWDREGLACASGPCSECSLAGSREPTQ
jgi:rhodanese-related sulfurtransferase